MTEEKKNLTARQAQPLSAPFTLYTNFQEKPRNSDAKVPPKTGRVKFKFYLQEQVIGGKSELLPEKLGDGNYGMVFRAKSEDDGSDYAIKVLYASPGNKDGEIEEDRIERVRDELSIRRNIVDGLGQLIGEPALAEADDGFLGIAQKPDDYIVLPLQSHQDLTKFPGQDLLRKVDVNLSRYAYSMPLFHGSLKDLVEQRENSDIHPDKSQEQDNKVKAE